MVHQQLNCPAEMTHLSFHYNHLLQLFKLVPYLHLLIIPTLLACALKLTQTSFLFLFTHNKAVEAGLNATAAPPLGICFECLNPVNSVLMILLLLERNIVTCWHTFPAETICLTQ